MNTARRETTRQLDDGKYEATVTEQDTSHADSRGQAQHERSSTAVGDSKESALDSARAGLDKSAWRP